MVHSALVPVLESALESDASSEWLFSGSNGYPLNIRKPFERARKAANLPVLQFHDLRRAFATYTRGSGNVDRTVAAVMGHRDYRVNDMYAIPTDDQMRAVVESMPRVPTEILHKESETERVVPQEGSATSDK